MSLEYKYVEANSTNLPKVDTHTLFDFFKNGRKLHYAGLDSDKENLTIDKYGDDSIGNVILLRIDRFCVVKASMTTELGYGDSFTQVRVIVDEGQNTIFRIECKDCRFYDCIHAFSLLMWLHRRTEETLVDQEVKCYNKPAAVLDKMLDNSKEDHPLTPKSNLSSPSKDGLNDSNTVQDSVTTLVLNEIALTEITSSTEITQTRQHSDQHKSENIVQESSLDSECIENSIDEVLLSQPLRCSKDVIMSEQETHMDVNYTQNYPSTTLVSQICHTKYVTPDCIESENSASTQSLPTKTLPLSQITNRDNIKSPKINKIARKAPYTQVSLAVNSPRNIKKQSVLSKKMSQLVKQPKIDSFFIRPKEDLEDSEPKIKDLFMSELVKKFTYMKKLTAENFMAFAEKQMTGFLCHEAEKLTRKQGTDLWMDLRYGRITASIVHEAAYCRTMNGSLVNKILGKSGNYQSSSMKRGLDLESQILHQAEVKENITTKRSGLFLVPWCPIIGASPDAIGDDFIVEIKAPSSDTSFDRFLPNGNISKKCKNQMFLQMYCTGMKKGVFCVADPNFEVNKQVTTVWLTYDEEFTEILEKAKLFWFNAVFPRLLNA